MILLQKKQKKQNKNTHITPPKKKTLNKNKHTKKKTIENKSTRITNNKYETRVDMSTHITEALI